MAVFDLTNEGKGAFGPALASAIPGDEIIYHIGEWCSGHHRHNAMGASDAGLCVLYQRRLGPRQFAYIAKKIAPRRRK